MGGGGEGGGPSLGKRAAFIIEQGAIMKTKQIFKVYHKLLTRIVAPHPRAHSLMMDIKSAPQQLLPIKIHSYSNFI